MEFTKREKVVLGVLVRKELEAMKEDRAALMLSNAPFFGKEGSDESDLAFVKQEHLYEDFLAKLLRKLHSKLQEGEE